MNTINPASTRSLTIADVIVFLKSLAPLQLAESWDNVGLLWGDASQPVTRVLTCLTLTPEVADEAINRSAELIISHHPVLFHAVKRITAEAIEGRMLLALAKNGIAVYCAHTAYDSAHEGINRQLAEQLGLEGISILHPSSAIAPGGSEPSESFGAGRFGSLSPPRTLADLIAFVKSRLDLKHVDFVGEGERQIERLAIACGSAAEFLDDAQRNDCQALLTGEARFHACLEARGRDMALLLIGHFASEQPAMRRLAEQIRSRFPMLDARASAVETDPISAHD